MSTVRIGCTALPRKMSRPAYFQQLDYLESALWFAGPVKMSTWKRWAGESPAGGLGILAPAVITHPIDPAGKRGVATTWLHTVAERPRLGHFRDTPALRAATTTLGTVAVEASASTVVFRTPTSFTPSASNRDQLRWYFSEMAPAELFGTAARVWQPDGLWEPAGAAAIAAELGLVLALDPFVVEPGVPVELYGMLAVESLYFRATGLGRAGGLRPDQLTQLAELAANYATSWVVFATQEALRDARRFRGIAS